LLDLRTNNPALAANAGFKKLNIGNSRAIYAYVREAGAKKILVILNLSSKRQKIKIKDSSLLGNAYNVFMGVNEKLTNKAWELEPWGYVVYVY
jgi:glycosidase